MGENVEGYMTKDVLWQDLYRAAMLEIDSTRLETSIEAARAAILWHIRQQPTVAPDDWAINQRQQMVDALENLRTLQRVTVRASTRQQGGKDDAPSGQVTL